ncbi:hypothetical protein [Ureaplasma ceti]|uniref:Uncharacterized protein n=1 Tax=Ureaplasma ceti TaxID=3119530 RepID=A0ABP9U524_9BACT
MKNDMMVQFFFNDEELVKKAYRTLNSNNFVSSFCFDKETHRKGVTVDILTYLDALNCLMKSSSFTTEEKVITLRLENVRKI